MDKQRILTESFAGHLVFTSASVSRCSRPFLSKSDFVRVHHRVVCKSHENVKMYQRTTPLLWVIITVLTFGRSKLANPPLKPSFKITFLHPCLILEKRNVHNKSVLIIFSFSDAVAAILPSPWFGRQITSMFRFSYSFSSACVWRQGGTRSNSAKNSKNVLPKLFDLEFTWPLHLQSFVSSFIWSTFCFYAPPCLA